MMGRPLLISDCDEVLLHMVTHFGAWLDEAHEIDFALENHDFSNALVRRSGGGTVPQDEVWPLLDGFFETEMPRQTLVPHAKEALADIARVADIVVLTNLGQHRQIGRTNQLAALGLQHRVICNQGPKGAAVVKLVAELQPSVAVFVDDLAFHHQSVGQEAPDVWRLHMIAEPRVAAHVPPSPHAHARIDDWADARGWVIDRLAEGRPAPVLDAPARTAG